MSMMVALVGAQPLPNFIPIRAAQPEAVLLIYTTFTEKVYEQLRDVLNQETTVYGLKTDPYNIPVIEHEVRNWFDTRKMNYSNVEFNLTGGTKAMSLAMYRIAAAYQVPVIYIESEGKKSRVYRYAWDDNVFSLNTTDLLPACVTLDDFLNIYLGRGNWREFGVGQTEGSAFESAVAEALRAQGYDVMIGVKVLKKQVEIDVLVRWENQFGIIEAKSGNAGKKLDGIKQLNNAVRQLGLYTQLFYVITVEPTPEHDAVVAASKIQVIPLLNYVPGASTLTAEDVHLLVEKVDKEIKGT
ncbi:DUF1887 family protein [bacterium]|nr:DUF1887 family protein [bacterium]